MNFIIDPPNIGAISATITAGQTATYRLNLQSIDGFAGLVTLTCTGAPAEATCTVIPTPVTLTANATAPFQVQVTTTARTGSATPASLQTPQVCKHRKLPKPLPGHRRPRPAHRPSPCNVIPLGPTDSSADNAALPIRANLLADSTVPSFKIAPADSIASANRITRADN